ncbi:MAG: phosphoribosylamine--glycine ligase [Roseiflexaceae bacterium]|nr:phosphoribosylamine--glycine ligase [Roseiflexaceae bacterium]
MKVLLVGSGGREHALAWKIAQSPLLTKLLIAPGNPGTSTLGRNVPIDTNNHALLIDIAIREQIDLVVIGPEAPLAAGLADACLAVGLRVFGPTAAAARIESSKIFAKQLMARANIPTAAAHIFNDPHDAGEFARLSGRPWVVKADGLAAGKGVIVPDDVAGTLAAIAQIGATGAGQRVLLEERLEGTEISLLALCDGSRLLILPPARDHKRLLDGDLGPNTGGMGAIAPVALDDDLMIEIVDRIIQPALQTLAEDGMPFCGALYAGLMLTEAGPRALEFNARFGDPETQVIMPLIDGDLLAALLACTEGRLNPNMLSTRQGAVACVVLAAAGYPETVRRDDPIDGLESVDQPGVLIFHAGTAWEHGRTVTNGGRVLGITGTGQTLDHALEVAYAAIETISFPGMQYRHDIGKNR